MTKHWPFVVLTFALALFSSLGLGYRHLWQDEIETAERARTILESGYPRVVDASGVPSVNTGGLEIEDGIVHRYSPWAQFYVAAAGLALGNALGINQDFAVRVPFALAHAATSGLISAALGRVGLAAPAAVLVGGAFGLQSVRLVHNRTARYHALLDLFTALGLFSLAGLRSREGSGLGMAVSIFVLPHIHTLAGSGLSAVLGGLGLLILWSERESLGRFFRNASFFVVAPGLASLFILSLLTRPWTQGVWVVETAKSTYFRGLTDIASIRYAYVFLAICCLYLLFRRSWRIALLAFFFVLFSVGVVRLLDFFPYSETRYYLSFVILALFWPAYAVAPHDARFAKSSYVALCLVALILPDLWLGPARKYDKFPPFVGVRLVVQDFGQTIVHARQPLHHAFDTVRTAGRPGEQVLIDYVPQFVNWYLPGFLPALVPEPSGRHPNSLNNPVWDRGLSMPHWHIWFASEAGDGGGFWRCRPKCDISESSLDLETGTYKLHSRRLGETSVMCILSRIPASSMANSPLLLLSEHSLGKETNIRQSLIIAKKCTH